MNIYLYCFFTLLHKFSHIPFQRIFNYMSKIMWLQSPDVKDAETNWCDSKLSYEYILIFKKCFCSHINLDIVYNNVSLIACPR